MSERSPRIEADGVPWCSNDECPCYDGKRCYELGLRPGNICEPEVAAMAARLKRQDEQLVPLRKVFGASKVWHAQMYQCDGDLEGDERVCRRLRDEVEFAIQNGARDVG